MLVVYFAPVLAFAPVVTASEAPPIYLFDVFWAIEAPVPLAAHPLVPASNDWFEIIVLTGVVSIDSTLEPAEFCI